MVNKSKHIFYFDALRTVAILCVVLLHVTGHLGEIMNYNIATIFSLEGIYETWAISAFKIGVDLFLLLSGALLLGRDWQIKEFFQRRMPRIIKPFLFWVIITCLLLITASYFVGSINYVEHFDIISILTLFYDAFLFKAPGTSAFWFFWMMFGVYLVMPIFNKWILNSDLKEVEYFLVLWAIVTLFENTLLIDLPVNLSYFTSPIGLVILGYYLRYTERRVFKNKYLAIILIVVPTLIMLVYSLVIANKEILFSFDRYSLFVVLESIGVFSLFRSIKYFDNPNEHLKKYVSSISACSYGIYLIHGQIIMAFRKLFHFDSFSFCIEYLFLLFVGFVGSWIVIYLLSKIPIIKEFSGFK